MNWKLICKIIALICFAGATWPAVLPPLLAAFNLIALGLFLWLLTETA